VHLPAAADLIGDVLQGSWVTDLLHGQRIRREFADGSR